jgi:uncharacterized protein (DUF924 family)
MTPAPSSPVIASADCQAVLDFWFGDGLALGWPSTSRSDLWWGGGPALDMSIKTRFGDWVQQAVAGGLKDWEATPLNRLALVILLDQFTRNVYRGSAQAFAGDVRSQALAGEALAQGLDQELPWAGRSFLYTPLSHSEDLARQDESVRRFTQLQADVPEALKPSLQGFVKSAIEHRDIIARFGRFPHRNAVLGRTNTAAEEDFIQHGPRFGQ